MKRDWLLWIKYLFCSYFTIQLFPITNLYYWLNQDAVQTGETTYSGIVFASNYDALIYMKMEFMEKYFPLANIVPELCILAGILSIFVIIVDFLKASKR